jgi:hypothetical protein
MTENDTVDKEAKAPAAAVPEKESGKDSADEPGLMDTVGSFPYFILKVINTVTPDFLRTKEPPKKNYRI